MQCLINVMVYPYRWSLVLGMCGFSKIHSPLSSLCPPSPQQSIENYTHTHTYTLYRHHIYPLLLTLLQIQVYYSGSYIDIDRLSRRRLHLHPYYRLQTKGSHSYISQGNTAIHTDGGATTMMSHAHLYFRQRQTDGDRERYLLQQPTTPCSNQENYKLLYLVYCSSLAFGSHLLVTFKTVSASIPIYIIVVMLYP